MAAAEIERLCWEHAIFIFYEEPLHPSGKFIVGMQIDIELCDNDHRLLDGLLQAILVKESERESKSGKSARAKSAALL